MFVMPHATPFANSPRFHIDTIAAVQPRPVQAAHPSLQMW